MAAELLLQRIRTTPRGIIVASAVPRPVVRTLQARLIERDSSRRA
jgi:hypothetical protein